MLNDKDKDLSSNFKAAWDNKNFYLTVTVRDNKLACIPTGKKISSGWQYDSIQIYFDTFCDAREREGKGHDENDYSYDIVPISSNRAVVYRRHTPEQQIAGGLSAPKPNMLEPRVKCAFRKTKDGYIYELAFPRRLLAPMVFEKEARVGFGIYVNDNDGKTLKSALTLTPSNTGCYMNPHLYPVMLLNN